jgi:site-specific DNA-methyltransferase (adenine-specific)
MLARLKFKIDTLVNEILDKIPQDLIINGTVLDPAMGGGQFVKEVERRKRAAGKTDEEIRSTVFGVESNILRRNYVVNKWKLAGTYLVGNALKMDFNGMKFDVVVGNPPYDLSSSKKIWPEFVKLSLQLVKKLGFIGMVIPSTWLDSNGSAYKNIRTNLTSGFNLTTVSRDANNHFNVGQDICYFIAHHTKYNAKVTYINNSIINIIDINQGLPKTDLEELTSKIIKKIADTMPKIQWILNDKKHHIKSSDLISCASDTHIYKIWQSTANKGYVKDEPNDYGKLKLAVNYSSSFYNKNTDHNNMPITVDGIGSLMGYILVENVEYAQKLREYLCSKPIRYFVNNYKKNHTGFSDAIKLNAIPFYDVTIPWTTNDLYQHFGLTQEEIDHIESLVN